MKLLFDENLSRKLVAALASEFPGSTHLDLLGMHGVPDATVWEYARQHDFIIVSKDNDFRQRAFAYGPPPKTIWLAVGNASTTAIINVIRSNTSRIQRFVDSVDESLLVLEQTA